MTSEQDKFKEQVQDIKERCDRNTLYISDREQVWSRFQKEVLERLDKLDKTIEPIAETYKGVSWVGTNIMKLIVAISVIIGVILGSIEVLKFWKK